MILDKLIKTDNYISFLYYYFCKYCIINMVSDMKKVIILLLSLFIITGCNDIDYNKKTDEEFLTSFEWQNKEAYKNVWLLNNDKTGKITLDMNKYYDIIWTLENNLLTFEISELDQIINYNIKLDKDNKVLTVLKDDNKEVDFVKKGSYKIEEIKENKLEDLFSTWCYIENENTNCFIFNEKNMIKSEFVYDKMRIIDTYSWNIEDNNIVFENISGVRTYFSYLKEDDSLKLLDNNKIKYDLKKFDKEYTLE